MTINLAGDGKGEVGADNDTCQNFDPRQFTACPTAYAAGSQVTLDARPPSGTMFLQFSGGTDSGGTPNATSCSTTPCAFPLFKDASVTATFAALSSITVTPSSASISVTQTQAFTATGTFVNGLSGFTDSFTNSFHSIGTWTFKADMPTARFGLAAGVLNGQLYALGGVAAECPPGPVCSAGPLRTVEAYDPSFNTWSSKPDMLTGREGLAAAVAGGVLYAIGGNTAEGIVSTVEAYDGSLWGPRAPMSTARRGLGAGVVNGIV